MMVRIYDRAMKSGKQRRYYGGSGFYNFGYWATGAASQREASEALVDTLLARLPQKGGSILDVACGLGASTKRLLLSYPPEAVTAINISAAQVATALCNAPGASVLQMDAVAKLNGIPGVKRANVEIVFDPPWDREMMSDAAKLQLGMM